VIKILSPLVLSEEDVEWFVEALDATLARAEKLPRGMVRFVLKAARANRPRRGLFASMA